MQFTSKCRRPQRRALLSAQQAVVLRDALYTTPEPLTEAERAALAARLFPSKRTDRKAKGAL